MRSSIGSREGKKVSSAFLTAQEIAEFIRGHPLFCIEKGGSEGVDECNCPRRNVAGKDSDPRVLTPSTPGGKHEGCSPL